MEKHTVLKEAAFQELAAGFRGALFRPEDPAYEEVRRVYNAMIDKRPALIAQAANVADVVRAVNFAREEGLLLAVRGGRLGACDGGMVLDLSRMRGIRVDPEARTVRVEGGCTWGDVDHATHAFGLATPAGIISTTGVGGLTRGAVAVLLVLLARLSVWAYWRRLTRGQAGVYS